MTEKLFCSLVGVDITERIPNGHVTNTDSLALFVERADCLDGCEGGSLSQKLGAGCPIDAKYIRKMHNVLGSDDDIMAGIRDAECQPLTTRVLTNIRAKFGSHL